MQGSRRLKRPMQGRENFPLARVAHVAGAAIMFSGRPTTQGGRVSNSAISGRMSAPSRKCQSRARSNRYRPRRGKSSVLADRDTGYSWCRNQGMARCSTGIRRAGWLGFSRRRSMPGLRSGGRRRRLLTGQLGTGMRGLRPGGTQPYGFAT